MDLSIQKYTIHSEACMKDAIIALNELSASVLTLFVIDKNNKLIGTLTDGDVRRALIKDVKPDTSITKIMNVNFYSIQEKKINVKAIKRFKEEKIKLLPVLNPEGQIIRIINLEKNNSLLPIDAVLMAGGKGTGLRPLTEKTPKPLLPLGEKPIIDFNIDRIIEFGIKNIHVTVNYLAEQIEEHFKVPYNSVQINCVREPNFLGTLGSIRCIENFENDTILIMNSDLFTNINFEDFYLHFSDNYADMSVAVIPYSINVPYGIFELDGNIIKGLTEKPTYSYYANSGIYLIKKEIIELIPKGKFFNATDLIELLISQNRKVIRFPLIGFWVDIGKPVDYMKAQEFVRHIKF